MSAPPAFPRSGDIESTWAFVQYGVEKILVKDINEGIEPGLYMNVYTAIHNFCVNQNGNNQGGHSFGHNRGAQLLGADIYNRLVQYLKSHLADLLLQSKTYSDEGLVSYYIRIWDRYTTGSRFLNNIFAYINRHWVKREREEGHRDIYDINTLCLIRWKEDLFFNLQSRLIDAVLKLLNRQRNGETIENQSIRTVVQSTVALGLDEGNTKRTNLSIYKKYFEFDYLKGIDEYYAVEAAEFLQSKGVVEYLKKATTRLKEEADKVGMYLRQESEELIKQHSTQVLVTDHAVEIQEQFLPLLKADRESDLNLMFSLLESSPDGLVPLQQKLESYVGEQGIAAVSKLLAETEDSVDPQKYVDTLLKIHDKYTNLVQVAFNGHAEMSRALDTACRTYINKNPVTTAPKTKGSKVRPAKTPELLAKYSDMLLRKSTKHAEVANLDDALNNVMTVLQFVEEQDAFEKTYTTTLARRLVNGTSLSSDAEKSMVIKLKDIRGNEYTNKLQRMFQDMSVSEEMRDQFREYLENNDMKAVGDFTPMILADSYWPLPKFSSEFKLPDELRPIQDKFVQYYSGKHNGRKLQWLWNFSKGELRASFSRKSKTAFTFQVSVLQMAVLLPFNSALEYTWEQLKEITQLDDEFLRGTVAPLVKAKVLVSSSAEAKPETGDAMDTEEPEEGESAPSSSASAKKKRSAAIDESKMGPGSKYKLNLDFSSKKVRLNLNVPLKSDQKREAEEVQKGLMKDRRMFLDACIVRIMKARKELSHVHLIQETIDQASKRFKPSVVDIKKCIESLIEREYLERVDGKTYRYLA